MSEILHDLAEKARERASNWLPVFVQELPDPDSLEEIALLGAYSFSLVQTRRRLIRQSLELEPGIRETPTAIGRDYLTMTYKHGARGTKAQAITTDNLPPPPNVAMPRLFAHGFYVDIKSCYWSIMQIIGWNVDYYPGMWLSPGRPPSDFPFPDHKVARNALVSAGRLEGIPRYDPRKLPGDPYDLITAGNRLKNIQLPRLIHDILNTIAWQCLQEGAIYVNNDGVIAPSPQIAAQCVKIITDWGLTATIKAEGPGEVKASGTYKVGSVKTVTYNLKRDPIPIRNVIKLPYADWLQREFSFFAAEAKE